MKRIIINILKRLGLYRLVCRLYFYLRSIRWWGCAEEYVIFLDNKHLVKYSTEDIYSKKWFHRNRNNVHGFHEPEITERFIREANRCSIFFDVGAHLGYFGVLFCVLSPKNNSVLFEMNNKCIRHIEASLELNKVSNATIVRAAVSDFNGLGAMNEKPIPDPTLTLQNQANIRIFSSSVPVLTLDNFCKQNGLYPELLKIDVEGAELKVLGGMVEVLQTKKPVIFLEVHPRFVGFRDVDCFLSTFDYLWEYIATTISGKTIQSDPYESVYNINIVAYPKPAS